MRELILTALREWAADLANSPSEDPYVILDVVKSAPGEWVLIDGTIDLAALADRIAEKLRSLQA
jgi:hypothetical protein